MKLRSFTLSFLFLCFSLQACTKQESEVEGAGIVEVQQDVDIQFDCVNARCIRLSLARKGVSQGQQFRVETGSKGNPRTLGNYDVEVDAKGSLIFLPKTLAELRLTESKDGLRVKVRRMDSAGTPTSEALVELFVKRPVLLSRLSGNRLNIRLNPSPAFSAPSYALRFFDAQSGQAFGGVFPGQRPVGQVLQINLSAYPNLLNALRSRGLSMAITPSGSAAPWSRFFVHGNEVGLLNPFYKTTQLQGHIFGLGLADIPPYISRNNDINYRRNTASGKEVPFVNSFSINRFLGGNRVDWLKKFGHFDQTLGKRSLDYAYNNGGTMIYQDNLIAKRLDPYLSAGYRMDNLTINIENIPNDLARDGGLEGVWGQRNPPKDWLEWRAMLQQFSTSLITRYPTARLSKIRFKIGNEYDNHESFNGTKQDYFNYYMHTQEVLRSRFPNASIVPGEFTGAGKCPVGDPRCVYDTAELVQKAQSSGWKLDAVPRSAHTFEGRSESTLLPSYVIGLVETSFDRLGSVRAEIHQFGILGQTGRPFNDFTFGSDAAAKQANWQFQTLMGVKETVNPAKVAIWSGLESVGSVGLIQGGGFTRVLLDHFSTMDVIRLDALSVPNAAHTETVAYLFYNPGSAYLVLSHYSARNGTSSANVRVNLPAFLPRFLGSTPGGRPAPEVIVYNQRNNVFQKIKDDLLRNNNLKDFFKDSPGVLSDVRIMAKSYFNAVQMVQANASSYESFAARSLNFQPLSSAPKVQVNEADNFVFSPMEENEMIIIKLK